jgi:hypothetical protein
MAQQAKTGTEILESEEWKNADLPMKRIIFVREVASKPEFADAPAEIQQKIIERFGVNEPSAAPKPAKADALDEAAGQPASDPNLEKQLFGELNIPPLPPADQTNQQPTQQSVLGRAITDFPYSIAGGAVGAEAGRRELKAARAVPPVQPTAAPTGKYSGSQNYAKAMATQQLPEALIERVETMKKTGEGGAHRLIEEDLARTKKIRDIGAGNYQLTGQGRGQLMLPPEEAARLEKELAKKQRMASLKGVASEGAQKVSRLLGKVPLGSTLMGAGAGLEGKQAYDAYKQGDYPLAAIHGVGALGSAASLIPHPATRLGGGALSLLSVPAAEMYKRMKK